MNSWVWLRSTDLLTQRAGLVIFNVMRNKLVNVNVGDFFFAVFFQLIAYGVLYYLAESELVGEEWWRLIAVALLFLVGAISVYLFGREGIIGNAIGFGLVILPLVFYSSNSDALWVIGVIVAIVIHFPEALAWVFVSNWKRRRKA